MSGRGYKDVLCINVCNWLLAMENGYATALYCSDVSGAFDRVSRRRLADKLRRLGLHPRLQQFLESWLADRVAEVVVGGRSAGQEPLTDSVFQGTVLGLPLWNVFYADARRAVHKTGFTECVFADDFNAWKRFRPRELRTRAHLEKAQHDLHKWGVASQVVFDPSKGSFHTMHRTFHEGSDFKLLGVTFEEKMIRIYTCSHFLTCYCSTAAE